MSQKAEESIYCFNSVVLFRPQNGGGGGKGWDSLYLLVVEKAIFVSLRVFSFKMSTAKAFSVFFLGPARKKGRIC